MNIETPKDWWTLLTENEEAIRSLIENHHPQYTRVSSDTEVTAIAAQFACDMVSSEIRKNQADDPLQKFDDAVEAGDHDTLIVLLNQTWFGVPENRNWPEGFRVLCDLCSECWVFGE